MPISAGLPASADALLATAAPRGRALYRLVRRLLDDLEGAAPWSLLYAPPADARALRPRLEALVALVDQAPERVAAELEELAARTGSEDEREALEEAEFYFSALHQMVVPDIRRLRVALDQMPGGDALAPSRADFYCELGADLKGKYSSAVMGATAALVSEGRWLGVEVEALLFGEKAEERARNHRLLSALESAVAAIDEAIRSFPWHAVLSSWRQQHYVDRYALADLVSLRAHLLRLLTLSNRRALYSGDYHQLQGREILLGSRLRELETLHLRSLDIAPGTQAETAAETFGRLHQLLLEVAALLDVEALRQLIGDELLADLRHRGPNAPPREGSAGRLDSLALLVVEEDLKIFLKLLVGAVKRRSSISLRGGGPQVHRIALAEPEKPEPVERQPEPPRKVATRAPIDPVKRRHLAARLAATLAHLTDTESEEWRAFQMVQKLQARLRVVPPALMAEMAPFLSRLQRELRPLLEEASLAGAVPAGAVETLNACHRRLTVNDISSPEHAPEIGSDLARVTRLLDSLRSAAGALAASGA